MNCECCGCKNEVVELDWIKDKLIRVEGFHCKECGHINISLVSDNALRIDLFKEFDMVNEIKNLRYRINKHRNSGDVNTRTTQRIIELYENKLQGLLVEHDKIARKNRIRIQQMIVWYEQERSMNGTEESILR
jgi:hypothetical protein